MPKPVTIPAKDCPMEGARAHFITEFGVCVWGLSVLGRGGDNGILVLEGLF